MSAPIEPQNYIYGVKVVQIEDLRVARGLTRRPVSSCRHKQLVYDQGERRIWCSDCESEVEAFDAFLGLVERLNAANADLRRRSDALSEAETFQLRTRAAKQMDEYWRSHKSAPCCPHCDAALMPEDVLRGLSRVSKDLVKARRKREESEKPGAQP